MKPDLRPLVLFLILGSMVATAAEMKQRLLVISVDGLDHRYLRDRDKLGLRIPNLRKLIANSEMVDGVTGVMGTVTWPSHTSIITGVRPVEHGILSNRRPATEGGDYYWTTDLLKTKTLWQRVGEAGGKTSAITWPVTTDAKIDYNLPEYFKRRNGGAMDLDAIAERCTPRSLVDDIRKVYPAFGTEWVDDRNRTLATMYIVSRLKPNLMLLHLVDLDSEQHERKPFTPEAFAMLEYTDELIGRILSVTPPDYTIALLSDHGFERIDKILNLLVLAKEAGVASSSLTLTSGLAIAKTQETAAFLRKAPGMGREVPLDEVRVHAPELMNGAIAAFEPAPHVSFGRGVDGVWSEQKPKGEHGLWPGRADYRSVFLLKGPGIKPAQKPGISMLEINGRLEKILGVKH
jgi:predicted AlkP superfamily pyrophosphatase or phosphodiesterase